MIKSLLKTSAALLSLPIMLAGAAHADRPVQDRAFDNRGQNQGAVLLFEDRDFRGDVREVFDDYSNFSDLRFNDRVESLSVIGGQWEVCEHANYTGQCVFVRFDVPDMREFGLNRKISSIRPVQEYTDAAHGLTFVRNRNGEVRYADQGLGVYGGNSYANYSNGYSSGFGSPLSFFGTSQLYRNTGFYNPTSGFGPYGFGYSGVSDNYRYRFGEFHPTYVNTFGTSGISRTNRNFNRNNQRHIGVASGALTLFEHSGRNGVSLGTNQSIADLSRLGFNDVGSSLRIREGRWEVCEHANFRGRCEIVSANDSRLSSGFNDRISSIRRIDGRTGNNRRAVGLNPGSAAVNRNFGRDTRRANNVAVTRGTTAAQRRAALADQAQRQQRAQRRAALADQGQREQARQQRAQRRAALVDQAQRDQAREQRAQQRAARAGQAQREQIRAQRAQQRAASDAQRAERQASQEARRERRATRRENFDASDRQERARNRQARRQNR